MPRIVITAECHDAILARAELHFKETGVRLPEGTWSIPVSQPIVDALRKHQMHGETLSDVILRLFAQVDGSVQ